MKLLILSDSHGTDKHMHEAMRRERPDYVIHLGDHSRDAMDLAAAFPMTPMAIVKGNCDFYDDTPEQRLAEYGGVRILMAHGHRYGVKSSLLRYSMAALENQVDVALFGHTHCAYCEEYQGVWLLNPGSCGSCSNPTYGVVEIRDGKPSCRIVRIDEME